MAIKINREQRFKRLQSLKKEDLRERLLLTLESLQFVLEHGTEKINKENYNKILNIE